MVNRWRGDVALVVNGQRRVARLTLGALAELEDALEEPSLVALVERFEGHRFSSRDVLLLLAAGKPRSRAGRWPHLRPPQSFWRVPLSCPYERSTQEDHDRDRAGDGLGRATAGGAEGIVADARCILGAHPGRAATDAWERGGAGSAVGGWIGSLDGGLSR